jgi:hypothetical protein
MFKQGFQARTDRRFFIPGYDYDAQIHDTPPHPVPTNAFQ